MTKFQKNLALDGEKKRKASVREGTGGRYVEGLVRAVSNDSWVDRNDPGNLARLNKLFEVLRLNRGGKLSAFEEMWPAVPFGPGDYRELPLTDPKYLSGDWPVEVQGRKAWLRENDAPSDFELDQSDDEGDEGVSADVEN